MRGRFIFLVVISAILVSACFSYPAMLNKSFPSDDKYEILGPISFWGTTTYILGIPFGGAKYTDLFAAATDKYRTVDDVVSVSVDKEVRAVLGIIVWVDTIFRGTAIRYVKGQADPTAVSSEETSEKK